MSSQFEYGTYVKNKFSMVFDAFMLIGLVTFANTYLYTAEYTCIFLCQLAVALIANIFAGSVGNKRISKRLRVANHGVVCLRMFAISTGVSLVHHIILIITDIPFSRLLPSILICISVLALLFWNGIICVYCVSEQLGVKYRVIGIICGMIPIAHLIALKKIIDIVSAEIKLESQKDILNEQRAGEQICKTKYPILMVHGVFFRDSRYLNYWGRIPSELTKNGATVYYADQPSAASVKRCAVYISKKIKEITEKSGCGKVNIIAHSKGGLDCRMMLSDEDNIKYVASLTTVNTPHRGCEFADSLLKKIPKSVQNKIAGTYNNTLKKLGESDANFMEAVGDLTAEACRVLDESTDMPQGVYSQSVGSLLKHASGGRFPLNLSYYLVKHFDGPNDGLVSESSFKWGERYTLVTASGERGISHGDMIDLNRENIPGFDVREYYVQLVKGLKDRGL